MSKPVPFWEELEGDAAEEWEDAFLERAAIMEYDGGMPRDEANRAAYRIVREQWRDFVCWLPGIDDTTDAS